MIADDLITLVPLRLIFLDHAAPETTSYVRLNKRGWGNATLHLGTTSLQWRRLV